MYFTLLFETDSGPTEIYELCFHPSVLWFKNGQEYCKPHTGPSYQEGDFAFLLNHAGIDAEIMDVNQNPRPRKVLIIGHHSGYGTEKDLESMVNEITSFGFEANVTLSDEV